MKAMKPVAFLIGRGVPVFALVAVFLLPLSVRGGGGTVGMAEVNGTNLYYETRGQGPPLLFIHGGLLHSRVWDGQFEVFAEHHRVIRYDAPGYGKSEGHNQFYSETEDVASLLRFLQVEKIFVIGASMGGGTAIDFTLAHPDMVEALVLVGPAVDGWQYSSAFMDRQSKLLAISGKSPEAIADHWLLDPYIFSTPGNPAVRQKFRKLVVERFQGSPSLSFPPEPHDPPTFQRLSELSLPVLIIVGQQDSPEVLTIADSLSEKIVGAKKITLPKTGHIVHLEQPEEFNRIVLDFLSKL